ncbi:MAG: HP1 family phage holin, partial [Rhodospirillaceae bacterium]
MVTYMGSFSAFLGGLGLNQIIAMLGLILAIATFFVNWFYKSQHL